jgi:FkbM family methyltransferase
MLRNAYKTMVPEETRIQMRHRFDRVFCKPAEDKITLGERCRWTILTRGLDQDSVIYSGGVGEDISFELALINRFGCTIQIFDPSPAGQATIARAGAYRDKLRYKAVGLSGSSQPLRFQAKQWEGETFFYKDADETISSTHEVTVPCTTIAAEMEANGHSRIDLLKLDIEGFEYDALESCIERSILPRQICVEFHNFMPTGSHLSTAKTIWKLRSAGYRLVHKSYYDWTFLYRERP